MPVIWEQREYYDSSKVDTCDQKNGGLLDDEGAKLGTERFVLLRDVF